MSRATDGFSAMTATVDKVDLYCIGGAAESKGRMLTGCKIGDSRSAKVGAVDAVPDMADTLWAYRLFD